jgi:hypothetical protein
MFISQYLPNDKLTCGDKWFWNVQLDNYPSGSGYVITYVFKTLNQAPFTIISTANIDNIQFDVTVPGATTASYTPGKYYVQIYLTDALSNRQYQGRAEIELLTDMATVDASVDPRTHNEIMLQQCIDLLDGTTTREELEIIYKDYTVKYRTVADLNRLKCNYQQQVDLERGILPGRWINQ